MKRRRLSIMAAMALSGALTFLTAALPTLAAEPGPDDHRTVSDTMDALHLSADQFVIEVGEIYQIDVLPEKYAAPLGWEFDEIDLGSHDQSLELLEPSSLMSGTQIKRFDGDGKETAYVYETDDTDQLLCFFVLGKTSGTGTITVSLTNPAWETTYGERSPRLMLTCSTEVVPAGTKYARGLQAVQEARNLDRTGMDAIYHGDSAAGVPIPSADAPKDDASTNTPAHPGASVPDPDPSDPSGPDDASGGQTPGTASPIPEVIPGSGQDITAWIDQNSLRTVYDGTVHIPRLALPAGYTVSGMTGGVDAGSYTDDLVVRDGNGNVVGTAQVTYVIEPSVITVRHLYDATNNTVITDVSGVVDDDVITIKDNGTDASAAGIDIGKAGRYEISTVVEIDESKVGNYVIADEGNSVGKTDAYTVKGNNPWYEVNMDYSIDQNTNQLTVNFYLENLRTEQVGTNASRLLTLEICVYFDEDLLSYSGRTDQYNDWRVDHYYPKEHEKEFMPDPITGVGGGVAPDLAVSYTGMCKGLAGDGVKTKICGIIYDINDGDIEALTNTVISTDNVNFDAYFDLQGDDSQNDIPAKYWADPSYVVINPDDAIEEHEVIVEIDPVEDNMTPHQSTCSPSTLASIKDALHAYVDQNMTETKPLTPSDPSPRATAGVSVDGTTDDPAASVSTPAEETEVIAEAPAAVDDVNIATTDPGSSAGRMEDMVITPGDVNAPDEDGDPEQSADGADESKAADQDDDTANDSEDQNMDPVNDETT